MLPTIANDQVLKPNPFFETMPAPEVWHRRMPPYFPFGETPYMEQVLSRQINADLARGMLDVCIWLTFTTRLTFDCRQRPVSR